MGGLGVRTRRGHYSRKRVQELGGSEVRRGVVVKSWKKAATEKVREEGAPDEVGKPGWGPGRFAGHAKDLGSYFRINMMPLRGVLKGCDNGDHFSLYQPLFLSFEF